MIARKEKIILGVVIVFLLLCSVFFGARKTDYMVDEVWTFGLANHVGGIMPSYEYGKKYYGMEVYDDFLQVKSGGRFNYVNVWANQSDDVHPPLYYVFVHTISSLFPDTFNMWYGITVNLIAMIIIIIMLYKLAKEITSDVAQSIGIILLYSTSVAFFDTIIFIRMYAMFTMFSILLAYLLKHYWGKVLDRRFYVSFSAIIILGMLTHYYFLIYTFFACAMFALHLIFEKRFKEFKKCIIVAAIGGIIYMLCWYHIAGHLFRGYRGKEAIQAAFSVGGLFSKVLVMLETICSETSMAFTWGVMAFVIVLAIIRIVKKQFRFNYKVALIITACLYLLVVVKIAPYNDFRYVMPVIFIYYIVGFTFLANLLGKYIKKINVSCLIIVFVLATNLANFITRDFYVPKDYYSSERVEVFDRLKDKTCVVYINDNWEAIYFYVPLQNVESYMFVNNENIDILKEIPGEYVLATTGGHLDEIADYVGDSYSTYSNLYYYFME
ncbi:Uncharacterized membrane protein [Pseudobutyrivibrio sp. 49]|uniref:glycosyltransferase family 39 protein n=1 Tax=Pseudobutyrivibrio sp. 49 TaxID=1855344 RepID=UPI0008840EF1|nr:glycosyltransferase family 39 protein [Pseudobutyrivibrio sp. 49]SDI61722.1 Uncharacterized membrane protein [Pseudobutyrivibrio sp. 49]